MQYDQADQTRMHRPRVDSDWLETIQTTLGGLVFTGISLEQIIDHWERYP
jgi:hypothetical protein